MKRGIKTAFVYIGLVIGAGFASGREIMEYFNIPSGKSQTGVILASFLFIFICCIILRRAYSRNIYTFDEYLNTVSGKFSIPVKAFMLLYLFCGFFTMLSGSGALLSQSFMLPPSAGAVLMAAITFGVLSFDLRGIVAVNAVLVPCMIAGIIYVCISSVIFGTEPAFSLRTLTHSSLLSAVCYVSYNTVSAASVLVPLSKDITQKEIRIASVTGGFILGLLILVIQTAQSLNFDLLWNSEIPMLKLSAMAGKLEKNVLTLILFMAICTTAVSQGFGILEHFHFKTRKFSVFGAAALCSAALPFAFLKFSALVAQLYSFFGIAGLFWMIWIIIDYFFRT